MAERGSREVRGRGRGRGRGTGRGRGRGKTKIWEWHNNYTPGPEIYNQLWHIRREPATVTPFLPTECPVRNAQSRIIDRRQTEGDIQRNYYVVEVKYSQTRETSLSSVKSDQEGPKEILQVDLSRILEYVSPDELERFETEQFRIETEAEAIVMRAQAEELAQKRLQRNQRAAAGGHGYLHEHMGEARPRGRPRGRGRGRGRGSWRGRSTPIESGRLLIDDAQEEFVDAELEEDVPGEEDTMGFAALETDLDSVELAQSSPVFARSAFVANSALPVSPILSHRRPSIVQNMLPDEVQESSDVMLENEEEDAENRSMSSAAMQLRVEEDTREDSDEASEEGEPQNRHRSKRRRTESTTSDLPASFARAALADERRPQSKVRRVSPVPDPPSDTKLSESGDPSPRIPTQFCQTNGAPQNRRAEHMELGNDEVPAPHVDLSHEQDAAEYVVENIIEHYQEAGNTFFLVKWQGYEDSFDWLLEEDLEDAAELVAEYKHRVRKREGKKKMK